VICLGYGGQLIREYFEQPDACAPGSTVHLIDTGISATIADRLRAIEPLVRGDELFLANYSDGLTDLPLGRYLECFRRRDAVAGFISVRISQTYHVVTAGADGTVVGLTRAALADVWINGGFFVFRPEIFAHLHPGEELVEAPFARLMTAGRLYTYRHEGFWAAIDTYKDRLNLERRYETGNAPWEVWRT
jgi:glucose-1-phosphate cytidylyltransferase